MRCSVNWLRDYVEFPWAPEELADRLTMQGLKVEALHRPGAGVRGVVVGEILALDRHPDADQLWVARVAVGRRRKVTVVTGATNLRVSDRVPVALPGAVLPGGWAIEATEFRGVSSAGMLLAASELLLGEKPRPDEGIVVLDGGAPAGAGAVAALELDDVVLEFDLTPNYATHAQSVVGVAHEVAAAVGVATGRRPAVRAPGGGPRESGPPVERLCRIRVEDPDGCPRYVARVATGVLTSPSPFWMQRRLVVSGMRPINAVVDVTNYVMLELGQPLHAFDLDRVAQAEVVVRRARPGERLVTLDGVDRALDPEDLLIADAADPVGLAGVMGGEASEVTADTRRILLESAHFAGLSVRRTAQRHAIRSEAAVRFEKWVDPAGARRAADRAMALLLEVGGAEAVASGAIDLYTRPVEPRRIRVRPGRVNGLLGTDLDATTMATLLEHLGLEVSATAVETDRAAGPGPAGTPPPPDPADRAVELWVEVPTRRPDLAVEADVAEEVARLYGYNRIATTLPRGATTRGRRSPRRDAADALRRRLAAVGFAECVTWAFSHPRMYGRCRWTPDDPRRTAVPIKNPMTEDQAQLRTALLPGLLDALSQNAARGVRDARLFEVGTVYRPRRLPLEVLPDEPLLVALAWMGAAAEPGWNQPDRPADFWDLKGVVEAVCESLGAEVRFDPGEDPTFHPGRQAVVSVTHPRLGQTAAGVFGELHPEVAGAFDLPDRVYAAELDFDGLRPAAPVAGHGIPGPAGRDRRAYRPPPRFPGVHRDVACVVPGGLPAARVEEAIRSAAPDGLDSVRLFDVYAGDPVPEGHRSLAFALVYRAPDRTLTDDEADRLHARVRAALAGLPGVAVR